MKRCILMTLFTPFFFFSLWSLFFSFLFSPHFKAGNLTVFAPKKNSNERNKRKAFVVLVMVWSTWLHPFIIIIFFKESMAFGIIKYPLEKKMVLTLVVGYVNNGLDVEQRLFLNYCGFGRCWNTHVLKLVSLMLVMVDMNPAWVGHWAQKSAYNLRNSQIQHSVVLR